MAAKVVLFLIYKWLNNYERDHISINRTFSDVTLLRNSPKSINCNRFHYKTFQRKRLKIWSNLPDCLFHAFCVNFALRFSDANH